MIIIYRIKIRESNLFLILRSMSEDILVQIKIKPTVDLKESPTTYQIRIIAKICFLKN